MNNAQPVDLKFHIPNMYEHVVKVGDVLHVEAFSASGYKVISTEPSLVLQHTEHVNEVLSTSDAKDIRSTVQGVRTTDITFILNNVSFTVERRNGRFVYFAKTEPTEHSFTFTKTVHKKTKVLANVALGDTVTLKHGTHIGSDIVLIDGHEKYDVISLRDGLVLQSLTGANIVTTKDATNIKTTFIGDLCIVMYVHKDNTQCEIHHVDGSFVYYVEERTTENVNDILRENQSCKVRVEDQLNGNFEVHSGKVIGINKECDQVAIQVDDQFIVFEEQQSEKNNFMFTLI